MQTAGEICLLCEHPVLFASEAASCPHCESMFHQSCVEGQFIICAVCGKTWEAPRVAINFSNPRVGWVEQETELPKLSPLYGLSVFLVCVVTLLLPVIYFGLAAAVALGVVYYALHYYWILISSYGPFEIVAIFPFYIVPLIGGILLTLLAIKPLFAQRRREEEVFSLAEEDAPALFELVRWICRSLLAPMPTQVNLNCGVNAGASVRGSAVGMGDREIVLSIGLPLAAGLNVNQLAGVIAHEYGHLSRGKTMRADYFIQQINRWFYDAVYEPDDWDLYLRGRCDEENQEWVVLTLLYVVRAGVAVMRGVLWLLLVAGNLFSSFLSRQMEFDADLYEMKISGSETFVSTTLRLQQLNLGLALAQKQMIAKWRKERKLFDLIPEFIVSRANEISADTQELLYARVFQRRTGIFDRHPSDAERTQRAREAGEPGVFRDGSPAKNLFANYPELAHRLTLFFYRDLIGPAFAADSLMPIEKQPARVEHDYEADRVNIRSYLFGIATDLRPLLLAENKSLMCRPQDALREETLACWRQMTESLPEVRLALEDFALLEERLLRLVQVSELVAAGFQCEPEDLGLPMADSELLKRETRDQLESAKVALEVFEAAGKARLINAVQLLPLPWVAAKIPGAVKLQDEAREMIHVLERLGSVFDPVAGLRARCSMLEVMLAYRRTQPAADNAVAALENLCLEIQERVNAIQEITGQIRYPFAGETEHVMIGEFLRNTEYHGDPCEQVLREGKSHVEKLLNIYNRLLGNLVAICTRVEKYILSDAVVVETRAGK